MHSQVSTPRQPLNVVSTIRPRQWSQGEGCHTDESGYPIHAWVRQPKGSQRKIQVEWRTGTDTGTYIQIYIYISIYPLDIIYIQWYQFVYVLCSRYIYIYIYPGTFFLGLLNYTLGRSHLFSAHKSRQSEYTVSNIRYRYVSVGWCTRFSVPDAVSN